jgi:hypothetical protein
VQSCPGAFSCHWVGRAIAAPSLKIYGQASNLLAGPIEHANCAVLIGLSVFGKFTCDDSSVRFSLIQGGKSLPLRIVNRELLASDGQRNNTPYPASGEFCTGATKQMASVKFPGLPGFVNRSLARRLEAKAALTAVRLAWPQVRGRARGSGHGHGARRLLSVIQAMNGTGAVRQFVSKAARCNGRPWSRTRMGVRHASAAASSLSARSANSVRILSAFFSSVNVRASTSTARVLPSVFAHALSVPYLEIS